MNHEHEFEKSKAQIKEQKKKFVADCECGWSSEPKATKEEAIIAFENHVQTNPKHILPKEEKNRNYLSLLIATLGILYIISPFDIVPDYIIGVGWIEDILIGLLSVLFIKEGLDGNSPTDILSKVFG